MRSMSVSLALLASLLVPAAVVADDNPASPFSEGSWTFQTYGAAAIGDRKGEQYDLHAGVGYFFADGWSFNVEAIAGIVDAKADDDGVVGGLDLLVRWHFHRDKQEGRWSIFLATGAGFQQASTNFPSDSHHNFRLNFLDLGGTFRVMDNVNLLGGVRYLHISNAGTSEHNNGLDAPMPYLGVMIGF